MAGKRNLVELDSFAAKSKGGAGRSYWYSACPNGLVVRENDNKIISLFRANSALAQSPRNFFAAEAGVGEKQQQQHPTEGNKQQC